MKARRLRKIGLVAGCAAATGVAWAMWDYARWRSLGPGGLPATVRGWLTTTRLRLSAIDPLDVSPMALFAGDDRRSWVDLGRRAGERPKVSPYPVPHRQLDQLPGEPVRVALQQLFDRAVAENAFQVEYALSHWEKRHPAIRCREAASGLGPPSFGEIAHIHPSDHSMHMILSPRDAMTAIEAGWGERHGLAGIALELPVNYVMVYAPRTPDDLAGIGQLLEAALRFALADRSSEGLLAEGARMETVD